MKAVNRDELFRIVARRAARAPRLSLVTVHGFMKIYDISVPIAPGETPVYPGDPGIEVASWMAIARGDPADVSALSLGAHTGTHVDAPAHFIEGAPGVTSLPLDALVGEARVVAVPSDARAVEESHVREAALGGCPRVLFKTRNSAFWEDPRGRFREDFTYIAPAAARALVSRGVRLVGIDYLSIGDEEAHRVLLGAGVVAIEGLDLREVDPGEYRLVCASLKLEGAEGAPARVLLLRD